MTTLSKLICSLCSESLEAFPPSVTTASNKGRAVKLLGTPCDHLFHRACLRNWFRNDENGRWCPQCHRALSWEDTTPVTPLTPRATAEPQSRTPTKTPSPEQVLSLVEEEKQRKAQQLLERRLASTSPAGENARRRAAERRQALLERRQMKRAPRPGAQAPRWWSLRLAALILALTIAVLAAFFPPSGVNNAAEPVSIVSLRSGLSDPLVDRFLQTCERRMSEPLWDNGRLENPFLKGEKLASEFFVPFRYRVGIEEVKSVQQEVMERLSDTIIDNFSRSHGLTVEEQRYLHRMMKDTREQILKDEGLL